MSYSQAQVEAELAKWNAAVAKLPAPKDGDNKMSDGFRFSAHYTTDGRTGKRVLEWELMSSKWKPTGIVWPVLTA